MIYRIYSIAPIAIFMLLLPCTPLNIFILFLHRLAIVLRRLLHEYYTVENMQLTKRSANASMAFECYVDCNLQIKQILRQTLEIA